MKRKLSIRSWTVLVITGVLLLPLFEVLSAQQDKVAAFKQSLAQNKQKLQL